MVESGRGLERVKLMANRTTVERIQNAVLYRTEEFLSASPVLSTRVTLPPLQIRFLY